VIPSAANPLLNRSYLQAVLRENSLYLSRGRGQNFLVDGGVLARILEVAALPPGGPILEIGAGLGTLSLELRRMGPVLAVESDRGLARLLPSFCPEGEGFLLIRGDFLKLDLSRLEEFAAGRPLCVVSNLPYSAAGAALGRLLGSSLQLGRMTCMLQKESAQRIVSPPGGKQYGFLSVIAGIYAPAHLHFSVPARAFFPIPRVDSAVVGFEPRLPRADDPDKKAVLRLVGAAFSQRRKMLKNALEQARQLDYTPDLIEEGCRQVGIDPSIRPERLFPGDFLRLTAILENFAR